MVNILSNSLRHFHLKNRCKRNECTYSTPLFRWRIKINVQITDELCIHVTPTKANDIFDGGKKWRANKYNKNKITNKQTNKPSPPSWGNLQPESDLKIKIQMGAHVGLCMFMCVEMDWLVFSGINFENTCLQTKPTQAATAQQGQCLWMWWWFSDRYFESWHTYVIYIHMHTYNSSSSRLADCAGWRAYTHYAMNNEWMNDISMIITIHIFSIFRFYL